jgi:hypothetical protein
MTYDLATVFPPKTIQLTLTPKQQEYLEVISVEMSEFGIDGSLALECYLYHLVKGGKRIAMKP